jgi:hypothetical protein
MLEIDFKREYRSVYTASTTPALVEVPTLAYLCVDGAGDPNGPAYQEAIKCLYPVSYGVRAALKKAAVITYPVMPLQGRWWSAAGADFDERDRASWQWTAMIMQPPQVTADLVADAIATVRRKAPLDCLDRVRLSSLHEGRSAQILHVGPYDREQATIAALHSFIATSGHRISGEHHEIYLSDARRTAPEKLRTIIRYPVSEVAVSEVGA